MFLCCSQYEMDYQILSDYFYANWTSARNVLDHYSKILKLPAIIVSYCSVMCRYHLVLLYYREKQGNISTVPHLKGYH